MKTDIVCQSYVTGHPGVIVYQIRCEWEEGRKTVYRIVHAQYNPTDNTTRAFAGPIGGGAFGDALPEVIVMGHGPQLSKAVSLACEAKP
jgi:hypothetical protein